MQMLNTSCGFRQLAMQSKIPIAYSYGSPLLFYSSVFFSVAKWYAASMTG